MKKILNNKSQFGSALTIVPGSSHAKFQYKPLGFEKFAEPLRRMQGYYDNATSQIDDLDFKIKHLPYGTDPTKAKQLAQEMSVQRDELITNLTKSKDYRAASRGIKKLQNSWTDNKNRNALESNYTNWMALDKEQKDRIGAASNGITRDQYYDWKQRSIQDFEADGGGTNFEDDGLDGTYNTIGRVGRLTDKTKELRELSLKIAGMTHSQKSTWFGDRGITDWGDIESVTYTKEGKNAKDVAKKVEDFLRTQPDFIKWAAEEAEYDHWKLTNYKEGDVNYEFKNKNYNEIAGNLVKRELEKVDATLENLDERSKKDKTIKDSEYYQNLNAHKEKLESQKENEYDSNLIQNLHHNNLLARKFNSDTVGELVEYQNITKSRSHSKVPERSNGTHDAQNDQEWSPDMFQVTTQGIRDKSNQSTNKLLKNLNILGQIGINTEIEASNLKGEAKKNAQGKWALYNMVMGSSGSKERKYYQKDPIQAGARHIKLKKIIATSNHPADFYIQLIEAGFSTTQKQSEKLYNSLQNENQRDNYFKTVDDMENSYHEAKTDKNRLSNITAIAFDSPEIKKASNEFRIDINSSYGYGTTKLVNSAEDNLMLKRLGIRPKNISTQGGSSQSITIAEYAKMKGYASVQDAYEAGDKKIRKHLNNTIDEVIGGDKEQMGYTLLGNDYVDEKLNRYFTVAEDLQAFKPAFSANFINHHGFDDKGNIEEGTKFSSENGATAHLVKIGNRPVYKVPVTDKDGITKYAYLEMKEGGKASTKVLINDIIQGASGNSELDQTTRIIANSMLFDVLHPNSIDEVGFDAASTLESAPNTYEYEGGRAVPFGSFKFDPQNAPANRTTMVKVKLPNIRPFILLKDQEGKYFMDERTKEPYRAFNVVDMKGFIQGGEDDQ